MLIIFYFYGYKYIIQKYSNRPTKYNCSHLRVHKVILNNFKKILSTQKKISIYNRDVYNSFI